MTLTTRSSVRVAAVAPPNAPGKDRRAHSSSGERTRDSTRNPECRDVFRSSFKLLIIGQLADGRDHAPHQTSSSAVTPARTKMMHDINVRSACATGRGDPGPVDIHPRALN